MSTKAEALRDARWLRNVLGGDWEVHVWENLGWHHKVRSPCGRVTVRRNILVPEPWIRTYVAHFHEKWDAGIEAIGIGKTPKLAVYRCVRQMKAKLRKLGATLQWP